MTFEEMVVALVGSIGAFALVGYLASKTFGLIKTWINRNKNSIPEEEFNRLAKAFMQYKKDTERRLRHLETIASEDNENHSSKHNTRSRQVEAPKKDIEINPQENEEQSNPGDSDNLRNMLRK